MTVTRLQSSENKTLTRCFEEFLPLGHHKVVKLKTTSLISRLSFLKSITLIISILYLLTTNTINRIDGWHHTDSTGLDGDVLLSYSEMLNFNDITINN